MMNENDSDNSYFSKEELQEFDKVLSRPPELDLTFDQVFNIKRGQNKLTKQGFYDVKDDTERKAAFVMSLAHAKKINVSKNRVSFFVYDDAVAYDLNMDDIETTRASNMPIDTESLTDATRDVNETLNTLAYAGDVTFGLPGVLTASGVTTITGADIDLSSNVANDFIGYFNSLPRKFRSRPYTLVLADAEYKKMVKIGNTYNDKSVIDQILAAIPNLEIVVETNLTAGTVLSDGTTLDAGVALLIPKVQEWVRMRLFMAPELKTGIYNDVGLVKNTVRARAGPVELVFPSSVGVIDTLNG